MLFARAQHRPARYIGRVFEDVFEDLYAGRAVQARCRVGTPGGQRRGPRRLSLTSCQTMKRQFTYRLPVYLLIWIGCGRDQGVVSSTLFAFQMMDRRFF